MGEVPGELEEQAEVEEGAALCHTSRKSRKKATGTLVCGPFGKEGADQAVLEANPPLPYRSIGKRTIRSPMPPIL